MGTISSLMGNRQCWYFYKIPVTGPLTIDGHVICERKLTAGRRSKHCTFGLYSFFTLLQVIKFLGKGSYGSVLQVQRLGDGQPYALKVRYLAVRAWVQKLINLRGI